MKKRNTLLGIGILTALGVVLQMTTSRTKVTSSEIRNTATQKVIEKVEAENIMASTALYYVLSFIKQ